MADDNNYKLVPPPPIAIVGMAMRLPAGVNNSDDFWDLLVNGKDGRCRVPGDRYNADAFLSVKSATGQAKNRAVGTQYGYFLQEDILRYLDASFFSMGKAEVERLDPQQKLLLEVVWECLENAGQTEWRGKDIGFYVGVFGEDWLDLHAKDAQERGKYRITGSSDFVLGNRMSYEYDFKGPRYVHLRGRATGTNGGGATKQPN
jgi:acyl transferase domain-containing protein